MILQQKITEIWGWYFSWNYSSMHVELGLKFQSHSIILCCFLWNQIAPYQWSVLHGETWIIIVFRICLTFSAHTLQGSDYSIESRDGPANDLITSVAFNSSQSTKESNVWTEHPQRKSRYFWPILNPLPLSHFVTHPGTPHKYVTHLWLPPTFSRPSTKNQD